MFKTRRVEISNEQEEANCALSQQRLYSLFNKHKLYFTFYLLYKKSELFGLFISRRKKFIFSCFLKFQFCLLLYLYPFSSNIVLSLIPQTIRRKSLNKIFFKFVNRSSLVPSSCKRVQRLSMIRCCGEFEVAVVSFWLFKLTVELSVDEFWERFTSVCLCSYLHTIKLNHKCDIKCISFPMFNVNYWLNFHYFKSQMKALLFIFKLEPLPQS